MVQWGGLAPPPPKKIKPIMKAAKCCTNLRLIPDSDGMWVIISHCLFISHLFWVTLTKYALILGYSHEICPNFRNS